MTDKLIFKIVMADEWLAAQQSRAYRGSEHDKADGFLHFSTMSQLPETLRRYYAAEDLVFLVAVNSNALGSALQYEYSASRNEDFPHLYGDLPISAVAFSRCAHVFTILHHLQNDPDYLNPEGDAVP